MVYIFILQRKRFQLIYIELYCLQFHINISWRDFFYLQAMQYARGTYVSLISPQQTRDVGPMLG